MDLATLNRLHEADQRARSFSKVIFATGFAAVTNQSVHAVLEQVGLEALGRKAAVGASTTTSASALAGDSSARAYLSLLGKRTVLGRLTGVLTAPPHMIIPTPTTDPTAVWISEGFPMPLAQMAFDDPRSSISKYGILLAFTKELFRIFDERAVSLIERITLRALRRAEDALLLSDAAAVPNGPPAGLLNGLAAIGGGSPASIADLEELWTSVSNGDPDAPHFVLSARGAMHLAGLHSDGVPSFPNISATTGGNIAGVDVILSKAAGNKLILIDAANLVVTDEGLDVGRSDQSAIQMADDPTNNAATATGSTLVSAFEANATIIRLLRWLHWTLVADDAVGYIELPINGSPA